MNDSYFASENKLPRAHEVTLRVRKMERQQAGFLARLTADAREEKPTKRSFLNALMAIALVFGAPRHF